MQANIDEVLIDSIQKYPFLYDKAYKDFRDVRKKNTAWNRIAAFIGMENGEAANKRFMALRAQYTRRKGSGKPMNQLMQSMSFLESVVVMRKHTGTFEDSQNNSTIENYHTDDEISRPPRSSSAPTFLFPQPSGDEQFKCEYLSPKLEDTPRLPVFIPMDLPKGKCQEPSKIKKFNFDDSATSWSAVADNLKSNGTEASPDETFASFVRCRSNDILKKCNAIQKMDVRHKLLQFLDDLEVELDS